MQTVANPIPSRKISKAFYAHLYDQAGALAKVDGQMLFMATETGDITAIEPEHCTFLTVLGEIGLADTQQIMDHLHGGYAAICTSRQTFRQTVAAVAEKARAILPTTVNGRIESACKLVLQGDVEILDDGSIQVGSSSDPERSYLLVGQTCTCQDFQHGKAPQGWCQHRIAAGIDKRTRELLAAMPAPAPEAPAVPLPEAPASVNVPPRHCGAAGAADLARRRRGPLVGQIRGGLGPLPAA